MKNNNKIKIIFILIISLSIFMFSYGNDFYWHLKTGEYVSNNLKIPYIDNFSWYASTNKLNWISHEWLFEVIIYNFYHLFSKFGIFIYTLILITTISTLTWNLNKNNFIKYPFYSIIWALFGTLMFANKILPRPHLFSYLFFTLTIYFAYDTLKNKNSKIIYLTPLITLLWSNIHGGSSNLGYIIYFLFLLNVIITDNKNTLLIKKYIYAFLTSFFTIIINPHTIKMLIYPYKNMTYKTMINCIDEWQSLNIFSVDGIFYIIFISIILLTIFKKKNQNNVLNIILLGIFILLGIKSTRFMPYLYIVSSSIIPNYWNKSIFKISLTPILISLILIIVSFYTFIYKNNNFKLISDDMINYLKENNNILYNSYNLGGYLIYKDIPVFIDSRADLYIDTTLCDVCEIEKGNKQKLLEKYNFDTFIVENRSKSYHYLSNNDKYKLIMQDNKNSIFIINPET